MTDSTRKVSVALLVAAAVLGGIVFVTSAANLTGLAGLFGQADAQTSNVDAVATAENLGQAFSSVAERVNPAVVQIQSSRQVAPRGFDPFGGGGGRDGLQQGLGSGAFVSADGYVVTNNHVVEDADDISVVLFDGREFEAEVVGTDPFSDLAVLRIDGDGFPSLTFGDSEELRVGQWVLAFGSPLDAELSNTVTSGIVSSVGRYSGGDPRGRQTISSYIQTDAAVNPGNSGGPLVNLRGEIVGINSAIATRTGTFNGISFAIPSNIVRSTVEQLIDSGDVERGFLGISFRAAPATLRRTFGAPPGAAAIGEISEDADGDTPAADAGLREGDLITAIDGTTLSDSRQIVSIISSKRPGDTVEVTYNRDGDERTANVKLGRRPDESQPITRQMNAPQRNERAPTTAPARMQRFGLTLEELTARSARELGVANTEGVLITDVDRSSEAFRDAGLTEGLVITEVNRRSVASIADIEDALEDVDDGESFLVRATQRGGSFLTALTKE